MGKSRFSCSHPPSFLRHQILTIAVFSMRKSKLLQESVQQSQLLRKKDAHIKFTADSKQPLLVSGLLPADPTAKDRPRACNTHPSHSRRRVAAEPEQGLRARSTADMAGDLDVMAHHGQQIPLQVPETARQSPVLNTWQGIAWDRFYIVPRC